LRGDDPAASPGRRTGQPVALITGICGQDGTYLAEHLRDTGRRVVGIDRAAPSQRLAQFADVRTIDHRDEAALTALVREVEPVECYHLAAYHRSSQTPTDGPTLAEEERLYLQTNVLATHALLSALRTHQPRCRIFLAGSCHMFGEPTVRPQDETTPFAPNSLYGITKVAVTSLARVLRERDGLFCCTGILFNHESPLRGPSFVTSRIARAAAHVARGGSERCVLGDLDAEVDWGFAGDYVRAMRLMLEAPAPRDYVISSGEMHRVRDFVELAFARVGRDWRPYVQQDSAAHRPVSRAVYQGSSARIHAELGWSPTTTFRELVEMMVDHHLAGPTP